MIETDLRDLFDDCYGGYRDFSAEIDLKRDPSTGRWENDSVAFWKDETLGWCYRTTAGEWNYGYTSLRDAVVHYSIGLTASQREDGDYCAHRLCDTDYRQHIGSNTLYCKTTWRFFIPQEDHERIQQKCDAMTTAFHTLLQ